MKQVWGVHMPESIGSEEVDECRVSIGWAELGDLGALPNDREEIKRILSEACPDKKKGAIPVEAGVIYRFVHEIKAGDYVVYPSKHDRQVNIGKFTGELVFYADMLSDKFAIANSEERYPNSRKVEWLGHFPRSDFIQSALQEIGSHLTLFRIKNHPAEFVVKVDPSQKFEAVEDEASSDDDSISGNISIQALQATEDYVIKRIHNGLSWDEFEVFVAHLLECMGYTARTTQKTSDGGVDVIAHGDELGFQPPIIKVQCKCTTQKIDVKPVRELVGILVEGEYGLFVSLGSFVNAARNFERHSSKLRLIDGTQLVELIVKHYSELSPRYRTLIPLHQIYVPDLAVNDASHS